MAIEIVKVPDLGGADKVDVIEICVAVGDMLSAEQSIVVLESDKASMEIPTPVEGRVVKVLVAEGAQVGEGDALLEVEVAATAAAEPEPQKPAPAEPVAAPQAAPVAASPAAAKATEQAVNVPDIGGAEAVDVIEVCVAVGDEIAEGDSLVVLESDKASMEIPSPLSGKIVSISVKEGDKVSEGAVLAVVLSAAAAAEPAPSAAASVPAPAATAPTVAEAPVKPTPHSTSVVAEAGLSSKSSETYAGPSVRKLARQLGVALDKVKPSGPRGRFTKDDVRAYVTKIVTDVQSGKMASGTGIPPIPEVDFSQFGEIELQKMSKIKKVTAANMSRNWLNVPHVTQFDEADITDLEDFRKTMKAEAEKRGVKLTPLPFLLKAAAAALAHEPKFNVSLHADGEHVVQKKYIHIGVAVDTPAGLMVPVIRDVDKKGLWELAAETAAMAAKARDGKLMPRDMQGACFTISSLGAMGGTGFTPIVNAPEVAIMGVSRAAIKPVWNGKEFVPRQMLPLTISYDHRAINGADCGRFFTHLVDVMGDIRRLLL